jgi:uncharacterized membrane protein
MRLERWGLLRILDVRDARAEAVAAGAGHRRDAIDQQAGRHPAFMAALFETAVACLGLIAWAALSWGERPAVLVIAGGALYIVGTIGVTIVRNVPLNDELATLLPQGAGVAGRWDEYVTKWTAWNHVRTVAALAAAAVLTTALRV